ncbi:RES family NAD+ phosphorylase [Vibrio europaeus]|uniref:RES family NAD+ phosphorylase n=1 Tax=Vibrio europaeus TaxID=300876 RepID=A0AAE7ATC8_9VIBR|nr:RES family NAD+ phosphorylase [Vibrio europaeus]QJY35191.1 RES family NAD+ phosphorylase [Vibrio europaeus]
MVMPQLCCMNCFTDTAITEMIQREGKVDYCHFCQSDEVLAISPEKLTGLFELVLNCVQEVADGRHLSTIYRDDLKIISSTVMVPEELTNTILGEVSSTKFYRLTESIQEFKEQWGAFKRHLIEENRFFPNNSLYGKIFITSGMSQDGESIEATTFLNTVSSLTKRRPRGSIFYRARISDKGLDSSLMGSPPQHLATAGRANPAGIPYLYLADTESTCFREVRPSNGATIYLSEVESISDMHLVDLTNPKQKVPLLKFDEEEIELTLKCLNLLEQFSKELSEPVLPEKSHLEYIPTQFICEFLRTIGSYDGLIFNSSYGAGKNVVLFAEDKVTIKEPLPHTVRSVEVVTERALG